jgi:3-deoxy-D-manno-octulosonate 8-phosphate phosphatase (KDO 8-P phosphatase)
MSQSSSSLQAGRAMPSAESLQRVKLLLLDVDGVLTDGRIHFDAEGREYKSFHVHDAAGIVYWHRSGGHSGFLSGRGGHVVERRAQELGVHEVVLGRVDKLDAFEEILSRQGLRAEEVAYVGDDLLDLPVMQRVAFAATVPQGRAEVRQAAHYVTPSAAGFGAARDVIEVLMRAQGHWEAIVARGGRA